MQVWVDFPDATYEVLGGEAEVLPGIRVIPTPGHTPGHGSVDPRRSGRESAWDSARYEDSVRHLRDLAPRRLLFSHDAAVWEPA